MLQPVLGRSVRLRLDQPAVQRAVQPAAAGCQRLRPGRGELRRRAADRPALRVTDPEVAEPGQVAELLDPLGADRRPDVLGEVHHGPDQRGLGSVPGDPGDQLAVQLERVRGQLDHPAKPGVGGPDVVDREQRAALAQRLQPVAQRAGIEPGGMLGQLDLVPGQVLGQCGLHGCVAERRGGDVDRDPAVVRAVGRGGERVGQRPGLELRAEADLTGEREPRPGGAVLVVLAGEPGERLVALDL